MTSSTAKDEKQIIKEIAFIRASKPFIEEIERLKTLIYQKKSEKFEAGNGLSGLKEEAFELRKRI